VVLALLTVFAIAVVVACGAAFVTRPEPEPVHSILRIGATAAPAAPRPVPSAVRPAPRPSADVCPQRAGVVPARPDGATQRRVDAAWKRIETWLAEHAPKSRAALRPPASAKHIDEAQRRMSVAFPADLVASLRRHDGVASMGFDLPPFFGPLTVDGMVAERAVTCQVLAEVDAGTDRWWDAEFVPFASAGDGGSLVVDQSPGGHGRVGEFYPEEGTRFERWPASVTELLEKTARSLETGRPYEGRYRPVVDAEGALDWEII
jgi:cell wall assembly regulator SMI1